MVGVFPRRGARARARHQPGTMNRLEADYWLHLQAQVRAGEIAAAQFEAEKLRLADRTFYEPDFRVVLNDGSIEMHEVKGFWEDDARVKIKVAAELHPYGFVAVTRAKKSEGGGWIFERFR